MVDEAVKSLETLTDVIPAKAGIQASSRRNPGTSKSLDPAPVFAGATRQGDCYLRGRHD